MRRRTTEHRASERFRDLDTYRARREVKRYEGTAQRDLFRELRERFLERHQTDSGWAVDLGSGPGRFLPLLAGKGARPVALDLSLEMLKLVPETWASVRGGVSWPDRIRGDALRPPLAPRRCSQVVVLGNTLGFAGRDAEGVLGSAEDLVVPGGLLEVEIAPSSGERSRYLARLPLSSVPRLLRAPTAAVVARVDRERFETEPVRRPAADRFRRFRVAELHERWRTAGWEVLETVAVAPALGPDGPRLEGIRRDAKAWSHLLEVEEKLGQREERWAHAAAVLLCARRPPA